jgi:hypothetical protein
MSHVHTLIFVFTVDLYTLFHKNMVLGMPQKHKLFMLVTIHEESSKRASLPYSQ